MLWKKVQTGLSAGRVQSVAVRLIVEREEERLAFRAASYWDLEAKLRSGATEFAATLAKVGGQRIATINGKRRSSSSRRFVNSRARRSRTPSWPTPIER